MKKIKLIYIVPFLLMTFTALAQTNNLTGSPYSLYGLGVFNEANLGKTNALGKSGVALGSDYMINNLNPASLASIHNKSFMFDIGFNTEFDSYENRYSDDSKVRFNFSNFAIAFPVSRKAAMSIVLTPFSNVGYELVGIESDIEGNQGTFTSYVSGSGGLNSIKVNYGYNLSDKLNVGAGLEYIFGNIEEKETVAVESNYLLTTRDTYYKNFRATAGLQYNPTESTGFGAVVKFPTLLNASQDLEVTKVVDLTEVAVDSEEDIDIDSFKLPFEFTVGFRQTFAKKFTFNIDYRKSLWGNTDQTDNIGTFKDQDFIGAGLEYLNNNKGYKYWQRMRYRIGFNYDNGYLDIRDESINNMGFTIGLGLPMSNKNNSFINLAYSYGQRGVVSSTLIQENYHFLSLNLSLENIWFVKSKYN
ncbi:OmpP1/FadL family transporter [Pustulibacterium marinum]|nr:hypothetical protein [Pustulibacterium marinum]